MPKAKFSTIVNSYQLTMNGVFFACSMLEEVENFDSFTNITNMSNAFAGCELLKSIDLTTANIYTSEVTFSAAFSNCKALTNIDLSGFETISTLSTAFATCSNLSVVNFPKKENSLSVSAGQVFQNCGKLLEADLSVFPKISNMSNAFNGCSTLTKVTFSPIVNSTSISFLSAFSGCVALKTVENFDCFTNISSLTYTFKDCKVLESLRFGINPSSISNRSETFHSANSDCLKWLPSGVSDIPSTWIGYYNSTTTRDSYCNFVLPLDTKITAPAPVHAGSPIHIDPVEIQKPYAARLDIIWQFAPDEIFEESQVTSISSGDILRLFQNGYCIRCGVLSPNGITYWSNVEQVIVKGAEIDCDSYSLRVTVFPSDAASLVVKDVTGKELTYRFIEEEGDFVTYRYTQGVPNAVYDISVSGDEAQEVTMNTIPTYIDTPVEESNVEVEVGATLAISKATTYNNLLVKVSGNSTYKNSYSTILNSAPITVTDGLLVEVDLTKCNDQWMYLSLPFDFDVSTGVRYDDSDGVEHIAELNTDVYVQLYSPASRALIGEGTKNWRDPAASYIIKAGEGFLIAKEEASAHVYKILALDPNCLGAGSKQVVLQYNDAVLNGRTGWDSNWNFIGNPLTSSCTYTPVGNGPRYFYRRNTGKWAGGYEIVYDIVSNTVELEPFTPYLTQVWGDDEYLTLEADNSGAFFVAARTQVDRNAFGLYLQKDGVKMDEVAWIFTPESRREVLYSEDAKKASVGKNCIWTTFEGVNLVYNNLPFDGNRMNFEVKVNADANSTAYKINMRSVTTGHHDVYIREANSNTWHDLSLSDYILPASTSSATRTLEVSIVRNQVVTSTSTQENSNVLVYSNNSNIFVEGVANNDVVSVITTSGVKVAEYSNNTKHSISNLALGSYLIRIATENGVVTKKVTNVAK